MRMHFHQLTEPIALLLDGDHHELVHFQIPAQLKSQTPRSRRLPASPWACGDPIRSLHCMN